MSELWTGCRIEGTLPYYILHWVQVPGMRTRRIFPPKDPDSYIKPDFRLLAQHADEGFVTNSTSRGDNVLDPKPFWSGTLPIIHFVHTIRTYIL